MRTRKAHRSQRQLFVPTFRFPFQSLDRYTRNVAAGIVASFKKCWGKQASPASRFSLALEPLEDRVLLSASVSIGDAQVSEGGDLQFLVTLSAAVAEDTFVTYSTANGSATLAGNDYTSQSNQTLLIPAGQTTGTIVVATSSDGTVELDETLKVNLTAARGLPYSQLGLDIDGEAAGDLSGYSVALSGDGNTLVVGALLNDGTGTDAGQARVYDWDAGTSAWTQRGADIDGEAADDASGYSVALSGDGNTLVVGAPYNDGTGTDAGQARVYRAAGVEISDGQGVGTILNDDTAAISIGDLSQVEGSSGTTAFKFTLEMDHAASQNLTVDVALAAVGNTAVAGTDYIDFGTRTVTFLPGQTSQTVTVNVYGDKIVEPDETFEITLANLDDGGYSGVTASASAGIGTILNDLTDNVFVGSGVADSFVFTVAADFVIKVNGDTYHLDPSFVSKIFLQGQGRDDQLIFNGSAENETATLRVGSLKVAGFGFTLEASSMETIRAYGGGGAERADFYDSAGNDRFIGRDTYSYLSVSGFFNRTEGFDQVFGYSTVGSAGGVGDRAFLYDSPGDDIFNGQKSYSFMSGDGFYNRANGFDGVYAYATAGDAGGGDQAAFYDSSGNDTFYGRNDHGQLSGNGFLIFAKGFQQIDAFANKTGIDTLDNQALDYLFNSHGSWEAIV